MFPETLYLLRHGESEYNAKRIFAGRSVNPPLSQVGMQQAVAQALRLEQVKFAAIYASPLLRARQTAGAVARNRSLSVQIDERLREVDIGNLDGKSIEDQINQATYRSVISAWETGLVDVRFQDGESLVEVEARFNEFLEDIIARDTKGPLLVVAHGVLFMGVLWQITKNQATNIRELYMGRGHLSIISGNRQNLNLDTFNLPPIIPVNEFT